MTLTWPFAGSMAIKAPWRYAGRLGASRRCDAQPPAAPLRVLEARPALDVLQPVFDHGLGRLLQVAVDRREDAQAALVDALPSESLDELAPDLLLEIEAEGFLDLERVVERDRRGFARSAVAASIAPELTIVCSTTLRRAMARSRLTVGA